MSGIARALAGLGAVAAGYVKGDSIRRDREQGEEDRAFQNEQRARMRSDWQRQDKQRDDTAAAAAPTTVEDTPMAMPIGSRDEPRAPEDVGIRAAGKSFTNRAEADKAAADYNAEPAVAKRVAGVARMGGDYAGSQQVMNLSRQGQVADMQLDEAKTAHLNKMFDDNLQKLGTHDDIANAISESTLGGSLKLKAVPTGDGKRVEYHRVNEDGSTAPTGESFPAGNKGVLEAKLVMGRLTPVGQKLEYLHKQSTTEQTQANADRDFTRRTGESDRDFGLRKQEADRKAKHDDRMLANDTARVGIARMAAAGKAEMPGAVWDKTGDEFLRKQYIVKNETGQEMVDGEGMQFGKMLALGQAQQNGGDLTTALGYAFAQDNKLRAVATDPKGGYDPAKHSALRREYVARLTGAAAPAQAPVAQPPAPASGLVDRVLAAIKNPTPPAGRPTAAQQPAAAPAGVMPPVPFQQFVAQNITSPAGKQAISQRVMKELPEIQTRIKGITDVMALPMVSGAVKAKLKGELDMLAQDAQMMQAFAAGNPGV